MKWNNASSSGTANAEVSHKPPSDVPRILKRSPHAILALFVLMINGSWAVYYYQFENLPTPFTADQAGKTGFSEEEAMNYVKDLTDFGPRPVGSDAVDLALQKI
ncbi:hypothetical protein LOK49_LG07G01078 [Camellia lanceoleosa]|uniref:Uncharacterized protein n=1 Tax=Camellia lanceoleosa TaxID=1840588 RepID=A0ACC0H3E8_9ERIC|nr:hypothetical protein LOK49_LG07G01078 [Camellia lanceoleosa]